MEISEQPSHTYILLTLKTLNKNNTSKTETPLEHIRGVVNIRIIKYHKLFKLKSFKKYLKLNYPEYKSSLHFLYDISGLQLTTASIDPFQHIHQLIMSKLRSTCIHYAESSMTYEQVNFITSLDTASRLIIEVLQNNNIQYRVMDR